jgi:hypothetical protein
MRKPLVSAATRLAAVAAAAAVVLGGTSLPAHADGFPSDSTHPDLVSLLSGFGQLWQSDGKGDLHGTVKDATTLAHNDQMAVWINNNATAKQQLTALQDANYDASQLIGTGLGSQLAPIYIKGLQSGALPLTSQLMSSMLAYQQTDDAKNAYDYPRPYLPSDPAATGADCDPSQYNGSSLAGIRTGTSYADAKGDLNIQHVPDATDSTGIYNSGSSVSAGYGGYCTSPSFPSGHTTNAYLTGLTLATLLPQLAPDILARASEMGTDRVVLGVHYPLDVIGGRISGEAEVAARWADAQYRDAMILPAQQELVSYLQQQCGATLADCIKSQTPYQDDPFGGKAVPGGTAQIVTDEASALTAYRERLTYGFAQNGTPGRAPSVPAGASALLASTYPTLSDAQRTSVLAQTEIDSGYPLDQTGSANGSWQRLDLAAAMTATVQLQSDGSVHVTATGGVPQVVTAGTPTLTAPDGTQVKAGAALDLVGAGFTAGDRYALVWSDDHGTPLTQLTAKADGSLSADVTIPLDTATGSHQLDLLDANGTSVLAAPLGITVTASGLAQSVTTRSPDGKTVATVFVDGTGQLGYTVTQNGETVVQRSRLGLVVDGTDWGTGVSLGTATPSSADTTYPLIGMHDTATDDYNGNTIPVDKSGASKLGVEIRVFDTGIAVRYDLDSSLAGKTVSSEETTFAFDPASTITYQPASSGTIDDLQGDTTQGALGTVGSQQITVTPTLRTPDGKEYANIVEADVRDWPAIALNTSSSGSISTDYWATDNGKGTFAVSANTLHSPFRVLTIASNLTDLTNSDIITDVNDPIDTSVFPGGDTSWIKPGVSAWASLEPGQNYMNQSVSLIKRLVDDASAAHEPDVLIEGMLTEASWGSTPDQRFANLASVVQYGLAEPNPVHVWLWSDYNTAAGTNDDPTYYGTATNNLQDPTVRTDWLRQVADTGVVGVKIDHIGDETESKVNLYGDIDKQAAADKLMVEFHNPLEPTGLNRTYPNEIGREAIRGVEINYAADQDTRLPFTRYVDGTADYTPLLFSNPSKQNNATWAHEVASTVVYTNPYLQVSEDPANLKSGGKYHDLIGDLVANMPTTWKRSWVLPQSSLGGRMAGYVRETEDGEYWVALMATPGAPINTSIPLDFLPAGTTYNADIYADGHSQSSLDRTTEQVTNGTVLTPTLASGGGYLVRITTKQVDDPVGHYTISSEVDLGLIRQHPSSTFTLTSDITLTQPWTPVDSFTGEIDGNGHTISGLSIATSGEQAFITENDGVIRQLGFSGATSTSTGGHSAGIVTDVNYGTIDQVYVVDGSLTSAYRAGMIAAQNYGSISNTYSSGTAHGDWETAGISGWNNSGSSVTDSYSTASVTTNNGNAGIIAGIGDKVSGDVALGGSLTGNNSRRVVAGANSASHNLALATIKINGQAVSNTSDTDGQGADATAAQLAQQSTYAGLGWDFANVWTWSSADQRPELAAVPEVGGSTTPGSYVISSESDLSLLAAHPDATFTLANDITLTQPWTPVPTFSGTLDGAGHTISALTVDGTASKAFIIDNQGTIKDLGFDAPTSVVTVSDPTSSGSYTQSTRVAVVAVTNDGTIDQVNTKDAHVAGGWRTAPIAAENNGTVSNSYTVDSKVVSNWETGALVGWNNTNAVVKDDYVAGADVTAVSSNGGILSGYGYAAGSGQAATQFTGDVVYSGSLTIPSTGNQGRINGQEKNGQPTYTNDLALATATINGQTVSGGTATNKNGLDTSAADLAEQATYAGIGWDFSTIWTWDSTLQRPVLKSVHEVQQTPQVAVTTSTLTYQVGARPTAAQLLAAAGATTTAGTLSIDTGSVDFTKAGEYTAQVGADNDGATATPVAVTIRVVPVIAIAVTKSSLSYVQGTTVTAAGLEADAGATLSTAGTLTADLSGLDTSKPGSYSVTLTATDGYGFTATPVTLAVVVTAPVAAPVITVTDPTVSFRASATATVTAQQVLTAVGATVTGGATLAADVSAVRADAVGSYSVTITATDGSGHAATPVTVTVRITAAATTTALAVVGQGTGAVLTATVSGGDGSIAGSVELFDGSRQLATAQVSGGRATFRATTLAPGTHHLTARFVSSETASAGSSSAAVQVVVAKKATRTTLRVAGHRVRPGQRPTVVVTVTSPGVAVTGQVRIYDGGKLLKTVTLRHGTARVRVHALRPGRHRLRAVFAGTASLQGSSSGWSRVVSRS